MDVIRFINPVSPTRMEQGVIVNGLKSKMWVERYAEAGEFSFVGPATAAMRNLLPIGSFVSHVDTTELMIVENHEVNDQPDSEPELVITGRGFETFFEQRIVGSNKAFPTSGSTMEYALAAGYTYNQAVTLIQQHILAANLLDDNDAIPFVTVVNQVAGVGVNVARSIKRTDLYSALLEILAIEDLGIKVVRPGTWSPLGAASPNVAVVIHIGTDLSGSISFSTDTGEIESAEYLWSNKANKNAALITGRWVETRVVGPEAEIDRRWMPIDASDIDDQYTAAPTGAALTSVVDAMQQRGIAALAAQNDVALAKAEVASNTNRTKYRQDFYVGDIITVNGDFNETSTMRISEYVEIEDETGMSAYPTLTLL